MGQQSATQKQVWPDIEHSALLLQLQSVQLHATVALSNVEHSTAVCYSYMLQLLKGNCFITEIDLMENREYT